MRATVSPFNSFVTWPCADRDKHFRRVHNEKALKVLVRCRTTDCNWETARRTRHPENLRTGPVEYRDQASLDLAGARWGPGALRWPCGAMGWGGAVGYVLRNSESI